MGLTIEPLTLVFGARVTGFSARRPLDDGTVAEIQAAFDEYQILHFPDQPVTDDEQVAFTELFGPLEPTVAGSSGAGSVIAHISNLLPDGSLKNPNGQRALFTRANQFWHTDSSFKPVPAKASLLTAREIPPDGGDTEYASTRAGYASLSEDMRQRLDGLIARHDLERSRARMSPDAMTDEQRAANPPVFHALVRRNPANGRKSLLVGSHIAGIVGMDEDEALALNDELIAASTQTPFTYRHQWAVGDMVLWDNRAVMHRGHAYDEANHRRIMIRTTLLGDGPTVVDGIIQASA
jgi:alpha-ketoglutarate-dependent 2,4-dichlorophenoxyacetate dioxygenase